MSIKKLFENNKQANSVGKYLKGSAVAALRVGMESSQHLSESLKRQKDTKFPESLMNMAPQQMQQQGCGPGQPCPPQGAPQQGMPMAPIQPKQAPVPQPEPVTTT